jgi:hypothetical protein
VITLDMILKWLAGVWPGVLAVISSSAVTALVVGSRERRSVRRARSYTETTDAAAAIRTYRALVLEYAQRTRAIDPDRDRLLATHGSHVVIACTLIGSGELSEQAQAYVDTGDLVAVRDRLTSADDEIKAFRSLLIAVVATRKAVR